MELIDTSKARMTALADAIRTLAPVLTRIQAKHGTAVARVALETAVEDCRRRLALPGRPTLRLTGGTSRREPKPGEPDKPAPGTGDRAGDFDG